MIRSLNISLQGPIPEKHDIAKTLRVRLVVGLFPLGVDV